MNLAIDVPRVTRGGARGGNVTRTASQKAKRSRRGLVHGLRRSEMRHEHVMSNCVATHSQVLINNHGCSLRECLAFHIESLDLRRL